MKTIKPAPIRKEANAPLPQARAFEVFTQHIGRWWFPGQGIGPSPFKDIIIEPRVGGRWFERAADGLETDWGDVLAWEPPGRVVLAWRIGPDWKFAPAISTELEIRFEAVDATSTRVSLEHRELDGLGPDGRAMAEAMDGGWGALLGRFVEFAGSEGEA